MKAKRYILVIEDGTPFSADEITELDVLACDDGYLSIIDVLEMRERVVDGWQAIKSWEDA